MPSRALSSMRRGAIWERFPAVSIPYSQGIDFRATLPFVSDPAGYDAELGTTANYPRTTAQGNVVGWEQAPTGTRNRSAAVDARLAGIGFILNNTGNTAHYRFDVPSQNYTLRGAFGDATTVQRQNVSLFDGTTLIAAILVDRSTAGGSFCDAGSPPLGTGVAWTSAQWPANNVPIAFAITTGIFRVAIGLAASGLASSTIATLLLVNA